MRISIISGIATAVAAVACSTASAAVIINENFDSYANTAAMGAVWTLSAGQTLDTAAGFPLQSLKHDGTASTAARNFTAIAPTASESVIFSATIFDDGTSANKRISAGLRAAAGANIIELGMYNNPAHYAYRQVLFASGNPSWVAFSGIVDDTGAPITNSPRLGWHTYAVTVTPTSATYTLDLNSDGIINATSTQALTMNAAGFNSVRLGGPSNLSSGGGGANFDNVYLAVVPEPASLSLIGLAGLAMKRRRI